MQNALTWLIGVVPTLINGLNFSITYGGFTFGIFDFFVAAALLGIVVRNFVHSAK